MNATSRTDIESAALETSGESKAFEQAAQRLHDTIAATYDPRLSFAQFVEAALRATLMLFAADPDLARELTLDPRARDEASNAVSRHCMKRYGALLRHAAAQSPEARTNPSFVEPALIGAIRLQIARRVLVGEADSLEDLLPILTEFLLAYYVEPQ